MLALWSRFKEQPKQTWMAYGLLFFLGALGAHRFYLVRPVTGVVMLALLLISIGWFPVDNLENFQWLLVVWLLIDVVYTYFMVKAYNLERQERQVLEVKS